MPRSYSRMLPGRMSTPLIFMLRLFDTWFGKRAPLPGRRVHGNARQGELEGGSMKGRFLTILLVAGLAAPALAQGAIGTVQRGTFACELPGDAAGQAGVAQPARNLTIESASRYSSPQGSGSYLRRGDTLTLTSGPRQGESYSVVTEGFLRLIEGGQPS